MRKLSAYRTYLLFSGASALFFALVFTVNMVYQVEKIHLNPLQLILVGTTLETTCFLFEVPTGIVADVYSRKLSVIIGLILIGFGFILEGSVPMFAAVLAAQVLWGIGATFISGAAEAWIAEEDRSRDVNQIYIKGAQTGQIGSVIGIILSTIIANFSINLPIIAGGCLFIMLALLMQLYMPEYHFASSAPEELNILGKMGHTFKLSLAVIRNKKIILLLLSAAFFVGLSSEGYDRLSTPHFLKDTVLPQIGNLKPVTWFGIFSIAGMLLSTIVMQFLIKRLEKDNRIQSGAILLTANIFYILSMMVFAITRNFSFMLTAYLTTNMFRIISSPIYDAWLNNHIDDNARATIFSTNGQVNALGQILGGPIIGVIAVKISISIGIVYTSLMLAPIIIIYLLAVLEDKSNRKKALEEKSILLEIDH